MTLSEKIVDNGKNNNAIFGNIGGKPKNEVLIVWKINDLGNWGIDFGEEQIE